MFHARPGYILLGVVGLSALTGYLDYVLLPTLAIFIGLTIYAIQQKRQADTCCIKSVSHDQILAAIAARDTSVAD
ncbi:mercury resistance system transport protein MerF [Nitrosomonas mobilis]|uniref:Uncharacterized protein n=1 Tax=Nitrosomonas mobilis TaxID=51642 RepID=A0A1G5SC78_9PROT|nr:mercury resistance system transport protein MerF [Nitrosomonas mobilis]SCZ84752.1 hypothetical protein NSMM_260048 [Nitrosomonas mobilis]